MIFFGWLAGWIACVLALVSASVPQCAMSRGASWKSRFEPPVILVSQWKKSSNGSQESIVS